MKPMRRTAGIDRRLPGLPEVPAIAELGCHEPQVKIIGGPVMVAPAATPAPVPRHPGPGHRTAGAGRGVRLD